MRKERDWEAAGGSRGRAEQAGRSMGRRGDRQRDGAEELGHGEEERKGEEGALTDGCG